MSHRCHPRGLRIGITNTWASKWFADRPLEYRVQLKEDTVLRKLVRDKFRTGMVHIVDIERTPRAITFNIKTARPAVVIGRGGSGIEEMRKELRKRLGSEKDIRVNVQEIKRPDRDAGTVALSIADQLERRMPFRRILKQSLGRMMQSGAKGARIKVKGRLNGADIARTEWLGDGNLPLHTLRANITYGEATAFTTYGTIGIKVWLYSEDKIAE